MTEVKRDRDSLAVLQVLAGVLVLVQTLGCRAASSAVYPHAAVAADQPAASAAGAEMLRRGGNAVDAAVATSFCLSVVRPYSCGIGGGGFMLIHEPGAPGAAAGREIAIDYRETAPAGMGPETFSARGEPDASRFGAFAVGVPGTVAGLLRALGEYGTLPRAVVLAPAIRAAEEGFIADEHYAAAARALGPRLREHPALGEGADYIWRHLCREGHVRAGDRIRNRQQAEALRLIVSGGAGAFYSGPIAEAIVALMQARGGPMRRGDLAGYRPLETAPLIGRFGPYQMLSMPPPSSGGVAMQQVLGILERRGLAPGRERTAFAGPTALPFVHLLAEALKHAFADRARWLADPAFVPVPVERLLDPAYLDHLAAAVSPDTVGEPAAYGSVAPPPEDGGTSHFCVIDDHGMAVACTETINLSFGSLLAVPGFGFALNDEMDDFTTIPGAGNAFGLHQSERNRPEPGKRPLSSMSPTIFLRDGRVALVVGASGGPRIITGTLQVGLDCLVFGLSAGEAVAAPRFHHQWMPDVFEYEEGWGDAALIEGLERRGHHTRAGPDVGHVQVIQVRPDGLHAASDPRKGGAPAGN